MTPVFTYEKALKTYGFIGKHLKETVAYIQGKY